LNLIVLHLGSGASICAIKNGKSLDTSMGLTPLTGLPGATRSGIVDPSLIFHYTNRAGRMSHDKNQAVNIHVTLAEEILNKKSGWKAITGTTDFGEIVENMKTNADKVGAGKASEDEAKWKLAYDLFVDRICDFIGAYYLKLGGEVNAVVFSGGIGEKSVELRQTVVEKMTCLGFVLHDSNNAGVDEQDGGVIDIGQSNDGHRVLVCRTDEQVSDIYAFICIVQLTESVRWRWHGSAPWRRNSGMRRRNFTILVGDDVGLAPTGRWTQNPVQLNGYIR
jgi:acetate kinase